VAELLRTELDVRNGMNNKDFTPESISEELFDYLVNRHFPHDELDEIGSIVYITDLCDIEIDSVEKTGSNFIVNGAATVETETDLGDGDTWDDAYPMKFVFEFDENGTIVKQHHREIDTSSFFKSSAELDSYLIQSVNSENLQVFQGSVGDILTLLEGPIESSRKCLHRLLYTQTS
jgi:hypothetical protein